MRLDNSSGKYEPPHLLQGNSCSNRFSCWTPNHEGRFLGDVIMCLVSRRYGSKPVDIPTPKSTHCFSAGPGLIGLSGLNEHLLPFGWGCDGGAWLVYWDQFMPKVPNCSLLICLEHFGRKKMMWWKISLTFYDIKVMLTWEYKLWALDPPLFSFFFSSSMIFCPTIRPCWAFLFWNIS